MRDHVAIYGGFLGNETAVNERPALDPTLGQPVGTSVSSSTLSGDIGMPSDVSDNSFRILSASNLLTGEVLDGFVISGANANVGSFTTGAAINLSNSSPAIRNCVIENNTSTGQGAAANSITLSQLNLDKCLVRNNHASISPIYMLGEQSQTVFFRVIHQELSLSQAARL
ncbi:hypothetical protein HMF3257_06605 [Spirosoma telluris]|uniref:Right-handed parallel beta-helix repeat-containing protein n=2 Tax=Spirosoma telluris TaxID=2183553 RepID=A0A327NIG7_9BACT|nr:hypothetical protein HMF3257_06605 [Spirosoma telluris]